MLFHIHTILAESDGRVAKREIHRRLANDLAFTDWEAEPAGRSQQPRWRHAPWYTTDAARAGFMEKSGNGLWRITSEGRKALELGPDGLLNVAAKARQGRKPIPVSWKVMWNPFSNSWRPSWKSVIM